MGDVECKACAAGLPIVWDVQQQCNMHLAPGLCTTSCARLDARAESARGDAMTYRNRRSGEVVEVLAYGERVRWRRPTGAICEAPATTFATYFEAVTT